MATKVLFTRRPFPAFPSNADWRCSLNVKLIQKWVLNDYLISMWLIWLRISSPKILFPAILYCSEVLYHQVCSTERTFLRISSHIAITLTKKIWTWRIQANVNYRWGTHCLLIVRIEPKCQTIVRQQVGWGIRLIPTHAALMMRALPDNNLDDRGSEAAAVCSRRFLVGISGKCGHLVTRARPCTA